MTTKLWTPASPLWEQCAAHSRFQDNLTTSCFIYLHLCQFWSCRTHTIFNVFKFEPYCPTNTQTIALQWNSPFNYPFYGDTLQCKTLSYKHYILKLVGRETYFRAYCGKHLLKFSTSVPSLAKINYFNYKWCAIPM